MTEQEIEDYHWERYKHIFRTSRGRLVILNEDISAKDALTALEEANRAFTAALDVEQSSNTRVDGPDAYLRAVDATREARHAKEEAKANAMAALFRDTGYWPYQIYELGLR